MAATTLTLNLEDDLLDQARRHAERCGVSLSRLVESFLVGLAREEEAPQPTGIVAELAGLLEGVEVDEVSYGEYLARKYS